MLQLLLDPHEALADLLLKVLDGLVRVSGKQATLVLLLSLSDDEILVAEGVWSELELEDGLVRLKQRSFFNEVCRACWSFQSLLLLGSRDVGEAVKSELSHYLVLALRLDAHVRIVEALDHGHRDVQHDVRKEHGGGDKRGPQSCRVVSIIEPRSVRLSDRDVEHEMSLVEETRLSSCEGVESTCKGDDEAREHDEEIAHQVHDIEDQANKVTNLSVVSQVIEEFQEQEKSGNRIDQLHQLQVGVVLEV